MLDWVKHDEHWHYNETWDLLNSCAVQALTASTRNPSFLPPCRTILCWTQEFEASSALSLHLAFRAVEAATAVPLNATAAGSSAAARHLRSTRGSIDLIRDRAAVYKCSRALPELFAEKGDLNSSLEILCTSLDHFSVAPLIIDASPQPRKAKGSCEWEWVTESRNTSFEDAPQGI